MKQNSHLLFSDIPHKRLLSTSTLLPFNCGDPDINDFFCNEVTSFTSQLLAVTYAFETAGETVAFFSVLNDKIINEDKLGNRLTNAINRMIPNKKRRPNYPAVKVGRLGVNIKYQGKGYGSSMLKFIRPLFAEKNKTGCRFITVDAYNNGKANKFYEKNGFKYLTKTDQSQKTRLMYYDLIQFVQ